MVVRMWLGFETPAHAKQVRCRLMPSSCFGVDVGIGAAAYVEAFWGPISFGASKGRPRSVPTQRRIGDDTGTALANAIRANSTLLRSGVQARAGGENVKTSTGGADDGAADCRTRRGSSDAQATVSGRADKFIVHRDEVDQSPRKQFQDGAVAWLPGRETRAFAAVGELNDILR